ncbi:MAG: 2-isopropylmalate synthase, partial [Cyanobacteria bacterium J06555_12]
LANPLQLDRIRLFDSTLRDGLQGKRDLAIAQRVELATLLERAGVDAIEAGYWIDGKGDLQGLTAVAEVLSKAIVCGLAGARQADIKQVADAIASGRSQSGVASLPPFRIHTFSSTQLKRPDDLERVIERVEDSVRTARQFTDDVQWTAMNATDSDLDTLVRAIESAIGAGASTICIADTQGNAAPDEFARLLSDLCEQVPMPNTVLAAHCHNHEGWAVDNALAALNAGARQLEGTLLGVGPAGGSTDLEKLVMGIHSSSQSWGVDVDLDFARLEAASQMALKHWPKIARPA